MTGVNTRCRLHPLNQKIPSSPDTQQALRSGATHPSAYPALRALEARSKNSNYWASLILKSIVSLSSGIINNDDVFVSTTAHGSCKDFKLVLPGCTVIGQQTAKGEYFISRIDASLAYFEEQERHQHPGLYRATCIRKRWSAKFIPDGRARGETVGISDRGYKDHNDAATLVGNRIKETVQPNVDDGQSGKGYDLFYTPGKGRFGGLRNYRQAIGATSDPGLHEPAILLADVMQNARGIPGITWFTDFGGSAILTQALGILNKQGVRLDDHKLYLYRPITRKSAAYSMARAVGLRVDREFAKSNSLNANELLGGASPSLPWQRFRSEDDYTVLKMGVDYSKGLSTGKAGVNVAMALSAAAGVAAALPAVSTLAGGTLIGAHLPNGLDRLKGKF